MLHKIFIFWLRNRTKDICFQVLNDRMIIDDSNVNVGAILSRVHNVWLMEKHLCVHTRVVGDGDYVRTRFGSERGRKRQFCCSLHHVDHVAYLEGHTNRRTWL